MVMEVEIGEKVETEEGVEIRTTIWRYVVTPAPPLEELVKIQKVEADDQIEIAKIEILPGLELGVDVPGSIPGPPQKMSFRIVATSQNKGLASMIRTQITIEDPSTGEKHTTGIDEFVDSGGMTGPHLGFFVEEKPWVAYVEVRVVP